MAKGKGGFIGHDGLNAPDAPTGVSGTAGDTQVTVSWTTPSDVGGSAITEYLVTDSTKAHTATGSSSPVTVTGLTNGTSYTFNVWAINAFGWSVASDASDGVTPVEFGAQELAVFAGGDRGGYTNVMQYVVITTSGNAQDFGDLTGARGATGGCASSTRGIIGGGEYSGGKNNNIDYFAFSSTGNAIDFGDLTASRAYSRAGSNSTRGIFYGGTSPYFTTIDYITIASTGNATDFGDTYEGNGRYGSGVCASTTRLMAAAGQTDGGDRISSMEYVTIASTGNGTDFGTYAQARSYVASCSDSTRGVFSGGGINSGSSNEIRYVTISTTGNTSYFGDLSQGYEQHAAAAGSTKAIIAAGNNNFTVTTIEQITIQTTGNSTDFGDLVGSGNNDMSNSSNAHGGL